MNIIFATAKNQLFVQSSSIRFISNKDRGIQQYTAHGKCKANSLPSAAQKKEGLQYKLPFYHFF
jgi:hypothetical protein